MKFEVGKIYKTISGNEVLIVKDTCDSPWRYVGKFVTMNGRKLPGDEGFANIHLKDVLIFMSQVVLI